MTNNEEYRARRRKKYAEQHRNFPMTKHRRDCINAARKRMKTPLEYRRAKKYADTDISEYLTQRKYESASISIFEDLRKTENIELYIE